MEMYKITNSFPKNETYYGRRVPFNINISEKVLLEYYDEDSRSPRWRRLCSNCNEYGISRSKRKSFTRGIHDLLIRATDKAGNSDIQEITLEIDY